MSGFVTLASLGVTRDPGTEWHPRPDKSEARNVDGNLRDLADLEAAEHRAKPEAADQIDSREPMAAEDSYETPDGEV